ncbi:SNF2 domain-containing protein [Hibiscus syriacus]|uniref:SNF2 domain-containing protein n=1 Tax=Hibiscus syriacus TaxID=106335 RepID=A0A6A2YFW8_HIBSY|nr:SNF2 domain-containing protein [Hibiscus syriacus]
MGEDQFWRNHLWRGLVPPRVETFMWQVIYGKLAVRAAELLRRGVQVIDAKAFIMDWGNRVPQSGIWKHRNEIVFEEVAPDPSQLFFLARYRAATWFMAKNPKIPIQLDTLIGNPLADSCTVQKSLAYSSSPWRPPPLGLFKLNVDGAVTGPGPPALSELVAVKKGLNMFEQSAWSFKGRVILESDSKICADWIKNPASCPAIYGSMEYAANGTVNQNYANILLMVLRLRQACDHPLLVKGFNLDSIQNSDSVGQVSVEMAKRLPREMLINLANCLETSAAICHVCKCVSEHLTAYDNTCPECGCKEQLDADIVFSKDTLRICLADGHNGSPVHPLFENSVMLQDEYSSSKIKAAIEILKSKCLLKSSSSESQNAMGCSEPPFSSEQTFTETGHSGVSVAKHRTVYSNLPADQPLKAIVFSQWTRMLDLVEHSLRNHSINYRRLDGTMSLAARDRNVKDFNNDPEVRVMLMALKAGNLSLNMVAACHVILLDLWWNPTTEDQAIDRAHRIGQTRPVTVTRITIKNTVEDRILSLQIQIGFRADQISSGYFQVDLTPDPDRVQVRSFSVRIVASSGQNNSGPKQLKSRLIQVRMDFRRISFRSGHIIGRQNSGLVFRKSGNERFASISSSSNQQTSSVGVNPYPTVPPPSSQIGLPLFWIGVGVGLSSLFTWRLAASLVCTMLFYILIYSSNGTERCVVHRDIKPSNILLSSKKTPKLCDFRLATWTSTPSIPFLCKTVKGAFGYLAPEYFQHGKVHDKTDVYAFGVILLELITGLKPIEARRPPGEEKLVNLGFGFISVGCSSGSGIIFSVQFGFRSFSGSGVGWVQIHNFQVQLGFRSTSVSTRVGFISSHRMSKTVLTQVGFSQFYRSGKLFTPLIMATIKLLAHSAEQHDGVQAEHMMLENVGTQIAAAAEHFAKASGY